MPVLAERYKIQSLGIFGSYVRGEAEDTSDIGFLVEFLETPDIFKFMDLEDDLTSLLGLKVDLTDHQACAAEGQHRKPNPTRGSLKL